MRMKKCIIRPFNIISALFLLILIVFLLPLPFIFIEFVNGDEKLTFVLFVIYLLFFGWLSAHLLVLVFRPKIILNEDYIEIRHCQKKTAFDKTNPFRIPKIKITRIPYCELRFYGGFFIEDITEYIKKRSGFLADKWMIAMGSHIPIPIKFPRITTKLRDVILFVTSDGKSLIIDGGMYGIKQVEYLLFELERHTAIQASGRVKPKKHKNCYSIDILQATSSLIGVVFWLIIFPLSTIWLEGLINPLHNPANQSVWRLLFIISILLANLSLLIHIVANKTGSDSEVKLISKFSGLLAAILYILFGITFSLSILL